MNASLLLAAAALPLPAPAPATPGEAVARQQAAVREAVEWDPCRSSATAEEIVVCGRLGEPAPTPPVSGYSPPRRFAAPERGPWFQFRRGPLAIACCGISTTHGSGSGLSLSIRF